MSKQVVVSQKWMSAIEIAHVAVPYALTAYDGLRPLEPDMPDQVTIDFCSIRPLSRDGRILVVGGLRGFLRRLFKLSIEVLEMDNARRPTRGWVAVMLGNVALGLKRQWTGRGVEFSFEFSETIDVVHGFGRYTMGIRVFDGSERLL